MVTVLEHSTGRGDLTLEEIGQFVEQAGCTCRWCSTPLKASDIKSYDHSGGIPVKGFPKPQWVYFLCSNPGCQYGWSLRKLIHQLDVCGEG